MGLSKRPVAVVIGAGKDLIATVEIFLKDHGWEDIPIIAWKSGSKWLEPKDYKEAIINASGSIPLSLEHGNLKTER